ncbi:YSC84-related protein [Thaumasiovibrio sp. DFM-14]|uniref:lipid-binding SYLF domain-containing protein n=1 Tax=Thaumasiovibrio sp. DFM-14 TaxID=3384792 RepID=UPI00399FC2FF
MKRVSWLFVALFSFFCLSPLHAASSNPEVNIAVQRFAQAPESAHFFNASYGYAVFPSIGKGGFWVGGAYGSGEVYRDNQLQGNSKLMQLSIGFQFGGQAYSQIVFFQDKRAYDRFTSGSFEFDALASGTAITESASARAGTQGVAAQAGEHSKHAGFANGMAVFTYTKGGLMIEASLAGQTYSFTPLRANAI